VENVCDISGTAEYASATANFVSLSLFLSVSLSLSLSFFNERVCLPYRRGELDRSLIKPYLGTTK